MEVVCCVPNYPSGVFFDEYSNFQRRLERWEGIQIWRALTIPRGKSKWQLVANYLLYPFAAMWTALRRVRGKVDVSFVSMPSPLLQALAGIWFRWVRRTPTVYWVQDLWPESATYTLGISNPLATKLLLWLCRWIYQRADLILVQSAAFPDRITRFGVPAERIRVFPNTAPEFYAPLHPHDAPAERKLVKQDGFRLMFAGNIGESQDFDTLIQAAELLLHRDELHWIIIGSGRDMERVQKEIARRGLHPRFDFIGRFPEERMPYFFAHADAMLVSLKDTPIFSLTVPYKVQCYMACGKPIVASLNGEGARIIEASGAGIVVPASSPVLLAQAIETMIDTPVARQREMGRKGRAYFEVNYAPDRVMADLERWLSEAAGHITTQLSGSSL